MAWPASLLWSQVGEVKPAHSIPPSRKGAPASQDIANDFTFAFSHKTGIWLVLEIVFCVQAGKPISILEDFFHRLAQKAGVRAQRPYFVFIFWLIGMNGEFDFFF